MADLIGNEKIKLSASWMNTLSGATYTGGVALPIIGQFTGATHVQMGVLVTMVGICLILAVAIHWYGQSLLGNLDDAD